MGGWVRVCVWCVSIRMDASANVCEGSKHRGKHASSRNLYTVAVSPDVFVTGRPHKFST